MKKIILSGIISLAAWGASAQQYQAPQMPVDADTKLITYTGVVEVPNTTKADLYNRTLAWMNGYYKNPSEVIRERDSVNMKVVAKPRFRIKNEANEKGLQTDAGIVQYTLTIAAKDNRFKYTISEINWKQASYFGIEKWVEQKDRYKANHFYLFQTDSIIQRDVIPAFEKYIKNPPKKANKDDW